MLEIIAKWNRWGTATLNSGIKRDVTSELDPFLDSPEIIVLMGPRRAGKTTILFQVMDKLESLGIPKEAMLHINFEEPALAPQLNLSLLDQLYESYREELYPEKKAYLFFDEIQNVPQWERWIRARNETENIKFFITGSSSQLMSRELGTLLTGRHVAFKVLPLSFKEFLNFKNIKIPTSYVMSAPPIIAHALNEFFKWGSFPAVVLTTEEKAKELLLKQYFDDVLFKDVTLRHAIRDSITLRNLAVHLLTQTGSIISFQRISKLFGVSLDLAISYCHFLSEAFLVEFLPFYSDKIGVRTRNPHKVYAVDLGLRTIANLAHSADKGHIIETAVFNALQRRDNDGIFYWKNEREVDFLIRLGNTIHSLIQVTHEGLDQPEICNRELNSLHQAKKIFKQAKMQLIAHKTSLKRKEGIDIIPLWKMLLECHKK